MIADIDEQDRQWSRDVSPFQRVDRGLNYGREHERQQDQHQHELDLDQQVTHDQDQKQRKGSQADAPVARRGLRQRLTHSLAPAAETKPAAVGEPDLSCRCSQPHPCLSDSAQVVPRQSNDCGEVSVSRPRARPRSGRSASNEHPMGRPWLVASPAAGCSRRSGRRTPRGHRRPRAAPCQMAC